VGMVIDASGVAVVALARPRRFDPVGLKRIK